MAVIDFPAAGDEDNLQGHYLARQVSQALNRLPKKHYKLADHDSVDNDLRKHGIFGPIGLDAAPANLGIR